jgi:signal transduction histidine kinase
VHDDILEAALRRAEERITMRRQLRRYTENLEQLVAEKTGRLLEAERLAAMGETIAGLSHTIKNIAGGLKGGAFVLEKGIELDERQYLLQGWEMIKSNVDKIRALSLDLLDYGKLGRIERRPCDPCRPAREVLALMQPAAAARGVELRLESTPAPAPVVIDPEALHRCLLNLVTNGLDACQAEDGALAAERRQVTITCAPASGGGTLYRVSDTGCGMPPHVQANLFRTFFSTKGSRGTGIGLMMTRRIVDQHGGTIAVDSTAGRGTTVSILIPGAASAETAATL